MEWSKFVKTGFLAVFGGFCEAKKYRCGILSRTDLINLIPPFFDVLNTNLKLVFSLEWTKFVKTHFLTLFRRLCEATKYTYGIYIFSKSLKSQIAGLFVRHLKYMISNKYTFINS